MRPIPLALAFLLVSGWAAPSQARWWGDDADGGDRPCFGFCDRRGPAPFVIEVVPRPRPFWAEPPRFSRAGFWAEDWRPFQWRREMRWRRFEAWRRWTEMARRPARPARPLSRWPAGAAWRPRPALPAQVGSGLEARVRSIATPIRAAMPRPAAKEQPTAARPGSAVAFTPRATLRVAQSPARATVPPHLLAAAAMLRRAPVVGARPVPAVATVLHPPASSLRPDEARPAPAVSRRPAALRAAPAPEPAVGRVPDIAPQTSAPAAPPTTDVPVAPLD